MTAVAGTVKPWFELVEERRAEIGLSQDNLAYRAQDHGAPATLTGSWISQLKKDTRPITPEILRGLAGALGLEPEQFAEYRLAMARRELDERAVGLKQAVANLEARATSPAADAAGADPKKVVEAAEVAERTRRSEEEGDASETAEGGG